VRAIGSFSMSKVLPDLPLVPPKLFLAASGETQTSAERGTVPFTTATTYLATTQSLTHARPTDLAAVRAVFAKDKKTAAALGFPAVTASRPESSASPAASALRSTVKAATTSDATPNAATAAPVDPESVASVEEFKPEQAHAWLRVCSARSFPEATSSLPVAIHRGFGTVLRSRLFGGGSAAVESEADDSVAASELASLVDLVQRENALYRKKLKDWVLACSTCGQSVPPNANSSDHVCDTPAGISPELRSIVDGELSARCHGAGGVTADLASKAVSDGAEGQRALAVSGPTWQAVKALGIRGPASVSSAGWIAVERTAGYTAARGDREALADLPVASATATRLLSPPAPFMDVTISPPAPASGWLAHDDHGPGSFAGLRPAAQALKSAAAGRAVVAPLEALIQIASTLFASGTHSYALPSRQLQGDGHQTYIELGEPLPRTEISAKEGLAMAAAHAVPHAQVLWSQLPVPGARIHATVHVTLPFVPFAGGGAAGSSAVPLSVTVAVPVDGQTKVGRPVLVIPKIEHSCKPRGGGGGGAESSLASASSWPAERYRLEELTKAEALRGLLALTLLPQAELHVVRVDAYTGRVVAVEIHNATSMADLADVVLGSEQLATVWPALAAVLSHAASTTAIPLTTSGVPASVGTEALLVKPAQLQAVVALPHGDVNLAAEAVRSANDTAAILTSRVTQAPTAAAVRSEYLTQANWPLHPTRLPFTFPAFAGSAAEPVAHNEGACANGQDAAKLVAMVIPSKLGAARLKRLRE
jgi:hypothetical protein